MMKVLYFIVYVKFNPNPFFFFCCCRLYNSSTACNVAVKILAPKFGRVSYLYSKAMRMDWFNGMFTYRLMEPGISLKQL